jgi:hypothetical protein
MTLECFSAGEVGACVDIRRLYYSSGSQAADLHGKTRMADQKSAKGDDGRGQPDNAVQKTTEPQASDGRLIPGGSFKAARTPIGVNAVDRTDLPSFGKSSAQLDYKDTPRSDAERPPHPPEPGPESSKPPAR